MSRSFSLRVEVLEDRCVPAADPLLQTIPVAVPPPPPTYVIDTPLIDPNAAPTPQTPPPATTPSLPTDIIPPIPAPFWY
jgi:hypothetical protein